MSRRSGHWGALLQSRTDQASGGLGTCSACKTKDHAHCRNRAFDDVTGVWGNCHCRYMDHGVRPSERMRLDEIAAPESEQDAYERTIGLD